MKLLFSSVLSIDYSKLNEEIKKLELAGADCVHLDIMDGTFVPSKTIGLQAIKQVLQITTIPIDVHLMVSNPSAFINDFVSLGVRYISVHQEACKKLHEIIDDIKGNGIKAGVALNPKTSLEKIKRVITELDFVLIMGVNPGFGGQKFIKNTVDKVLSMKKIISKIGLNTKIQVDGGINMNNIHLLAEAGADYFVVGSAIINSNDYFSSIEKLKQNLFFNKKNRRLE